MFSANPWQEIFSLTLIPLFLYISNNEYIIHILKHDDTWEIAYLNLAII